MAADKPSLRLGSTAPNFQADTTQGPIDFHEFIGDSWVILFSHPADFTPVCTTELGAVSKLSKEFEKRNVKTIGLSCNELGDHDKWISDINKTQGTDLKFPIIADPTRKVAALYDMLDYQDATNVDAKGIPFTVRSVFVIDPKKTIRLTLTYPASTGRSFPEILRVIDSLQLGDKNRITTPANWQVGDKVIVHPGVSNDEATKLFGEFDTVLPYLRLTVGGCEQITAGSGSHGPAANRTPRTSRLKRTSACWFSVENILSASFAASLPCVFLSVQVAHLDGEHSSPACHRRFARSLRVRPSARASRKAAIRTDNSGAANRTSRPFHPPFVPPFPSASLPCAAMATDARTQAALEELEAAVQRTGGRRVQYTPASKEDCISACSNMVELMVGRNPVAAKKKAPSPPADEVEEAAKTLAAISGWFASRVDGFKERMGSRIADAVYQHCLLDCVDDTDKNFPKQLAQCWSKAKTEEDEINCNQLAADWRLRARADFDAQKLKEAANLIDDVAGKRTWAEFFGFGGEKK
ncbi:thioredoxin-like protein [Hyaloraphidium curvatum]|nr:thioredoxin-like protein [Hyaloraphidium curvatum]